MKRPPRNILEIQKLVLDDEWCEFPQTYEGWLQILEEYRQKLREAETEMELVEAQIKTKIRKSAVKITEASVKERMILHPEYQRMTKEINRTKRRVGILDAFCKGLDAKRKGMEKLVDLHGQQFWSKPRSKNKDDQDDLEKQYVRKRFKV